MQRSARVVLQVTLQMQEGMNCVRTYKQEVVSSNKNDNVFAGGKRSLTILDYVKEPITRCCLRDGNHKVARWGQRLFCQRFQTKRTINHVGLDGVIYQLEARIR